MGDTELAESMHGCIAVMGRGVCTFTEKAERAVRAGAAGVIFVNHEDRLFDVIGDAADINIPVIAVARVGADKIPDGAVVALSFDESWGSGGGLVSPPLHHIQTAKGAALLPCPPSPLFCVWSSPLAAFADEHRILTLAP